MKGSRTDFYAGNYFTRLRARLKRRPNKLRLGRLSMPMPLRGFIGPVRPPGPYPLVVGKKRGIEHMSTVEERPHRLRRNISEQKSGKKRKDWKHFALRGVRNGVGFLTSLYAMYKGQKYFDRPLNPEDKKKIMLWALKHRHDEF